MKGKGSFHVVFIVIVFSAFFILSSCTEKKMTLRQARKVAIALTRKTFVPPPRSPDYLIDILEKARVDKAHLAKLKAKADAPAPDGADVRFYYERALAAEKLGRIGQWLDDLRSAAKCVRPIIDRTWIYKVFPRLAYAEWMLNNHDAAIQTLELEKRLLPEPTPANQQLVAYYSLLGDMKRALKEKEEALMAMANWKGLWRPYKKLTMDAYISEAQGRYEEAVKYRREAMKLRMRLPKFHSKDLLSEQIVHRKHIAKDMMFLKRYLEAEVEAIDVLNDSIQKYGFHSPQTGHIILLLAAILSRKGDNKSPIRLLRTYFDAMEQAGLPDNTPLAVGLRYRMGEFLSKQGMWVEALEQFRRAYAFEDRHPYVFRYFYSLRDMSFPITLMKTGYQKEALELLKSSFLNPTERFAFRHPRDAVVNGIAAVLYADMGQPEKALEYFKRSVRPMIKNGTGSYQERRIIFERYLEFLDEMKNTRLGRAYKIRTEKEAFFMACVLESGYVQTALFQNIARSAITNPALADLARKEQDIQNQIEAVQEQLANHLMAFGKNKEAEIIQDLKGNISDLRRARKVLRREIKNRFPEYEELLNPRPVTIKKVKEHLLPEECMIVIHTGYDRTFVWAIPSRGEARRVILDLSEEETLGIISRLRKAFDTKRVLLGDIPEFDLGAAYQLYNRLLRPVESVWKDARDLLVVTSGPLGQIPFAMLPTSLPHIEAEEGLLFARYKEVPWLIRRVSITRLPSVSSFLLLRTSRRKIHHRKPFAGFGDPLFNVAQLARARSEKKNRMLQLAARSNSLRVRGLRVTKLGSLDNRRIVSCGLDMLQRLPDTADEVLSIAKTLGADRGSVFLREHASEKTVKNLDLSDRRVIAFATHALVPGDLDGLLEPAIALSSPVVTGEKEEDGLLKASEIMKLELNADWVLLSGCNTGAANGKGAEAISGLGRAFFYAGAKALLVSMWNVETTSARKLTTGIFHFQKTDRSLSKARALQKSIIDLMDRQVLKEPDTGKIAAAYAHPFFWAPFIIVGDGR